MSTQTCNPERRGIAVTCTVCHLRKKPVGRSAPMETASSLCDFECTGYNLAPLPGDLWPGETCSAFGYSHVHDATEPITPQEDR